MLSVQRENSTGMKLIMGNRASRLIRRLNRVKVAKEDQAVVGMAWARTANADDNTINRSR
jgi:hypothetical protein